MSEHEERKSGEKAADDATLAPKESANKKVPQKAKFILTFMLVHSVCAAAIGSGFQHGYNTGVINSPAGIMQAWINETNWAEVQQSKEKMEMIWSVVTSIFCVGGIIGGASTGTFSRRIGRRMTLIFNNGVAILAGVLMGVSKMAGAPVLLIIGRLVVGVNVGLNAGVCPMYLSEISPMRLRGAIGSMYQLVITISILVSQLISLEKALGGKDTWPILFFLLIIVSIYQIIGLYFSPESPKYLLEKDLDEKAMKVCVKLCGEQEAQHNFDLIKNELAAAKDLPKVTMNEMLKKRVYRKPLIIMCLLMAAQQLSGINAVMFYSTQIFKGANLSDEAAQYATVGVGLVNVLVTIASVVLVETMGRKPLLAIGFGGMTVVTILIMICLNYVDSISWMAIAAIAFIYVYIVLFAIGAGSIPWILGSELFATAARPLGISIAVPTNWTANFVVALAFLPLSNPHVMGVYVFSIFIVSNFCALVYFMLAVPETKNRPIEEITAKFQ